MRSRVSCVGTITLDNIIILHTHTLVKTGVSKTKVG